MLRNRSLIETLNDPLKNISPLEHSCYHSLTVLGLIGWLIL
ncbi:MAG: hypothetical protein HC877_21980 [Thioploca sp.]|nr:hypothetical protein [Thioploca sp.]